MKYLNEQYFDKTKTSKASIVNAEDDEFYRHKWKLYYNFKIYWEEDDRLEGVWKNFVGKLNKMFSNVRFAEKFKGFVDIEIDDCGSTIESFFYNQGDDTKDLLSLIRRFFSMEDGVFGEDTKMCIGCGVLFDPKRTVPYKVFLDFVQCMQGLIFGTFLPHRWIDSGSIDEGEFNWFLEDNQNVCADLREFTTTAIRPMYEVIFGCRDSETYQVSDSHGFGRTAFAFNGVRILGKHSKKRISDVKHGDFIYVDSQGRLTLDENEENIPVALCIIDAEYTTDGSARFVSLNYMNHHNPKNGSTTPIQMKFCDEVRPVEIEGNPRRNSVDETSKKYNFYHLYAAMDNNEFKVGTHGMDNTYGLCRWNNRITSEYVFISPLLYAVYNYSPYGTSRGDWYIPSCIELKCMNTFEHEKCSDDMKQLYSRYVSWYDALAPNNAQYSKLQAWTSEEYPNNGLMGYSYDFYGGGGYGAEKYALRDIPLLGSFAFIAVKD